MAEKADIKDLAVAAWRLEKWLDNLVADRKMAAKSSLRSIKKYIVDSGIEVKDPIGSKFDPGLAVEVVGNENEDADDNELIVIETITPYVYQNGELIQYARVIIGTEVKKADNDMPDMAEQTVIYENSNENVQTIIPNSTPEYEDNKDKNIVYDLERMLKDAKVL